MLALSLAPRPLKYEAFLLWQPPAYVSIRQHTSVYVSIPLEDEAFLLLQAQDAVFNRALSDDSRLRAIKNKIERDEGCFGGSLCLDVCFCLKKTGLSETDKVE